MRFLSSTADSSWAVPSVASRSISALTMPWTNSRAARTRTTATTMTIRIGRAFARRTSTTVDQGGSAKSGMPEG